MELKKYIAFFVALLVLVSCEYTFPEEDLPSEKDLGEINTENIVAVGDGFLAGVMDGALYSAGQENSVGAIVAGQLALAKETPFLQPGIESENGYNLFVNDESGIYGKWFYKYSNKTDEKPGLILSVGEAVPGYDGDKSILNNLAIPNLRAVELILPGLENDPFFERTFTDNRTSIVDQVVQRAPSFVICWVGINDYLDYAYTGATIPELLIDPAEFRAGISVLFEELIQKTESKIVVGNLLPIDDLPFFYTRQYNFIRLTNQQKGAAQSRYSDYNTAVAAYNVGKPYDEKRPMISFEDNGATLYPQPVVVIDNSLPRATYPNGDPLENYRQLTEGEMALFSMSDNLVENGLGWMEPAAESYYLTRERVEEINDRVRDFNKILLELAQMYPDRMVVADLAGEVKKIADTGKYDAWGVPASDQTVYADGVPLEGGLGMNSIFSLDGIHFNQRGNAFIANLFIKQINASFGANIPLVDVNGYAGNLYVF